MRRQSIHTLVYTLGRFQLAVHLPLWFLKVGEHQRTHTDSNPSSGLNPEPCNATCCSTVELGRCLTAYMGLGLICLLMKIYNNNIHMQVIWY